MIRRLAFVVAAVAAIVVAILPLAVGPAVAGAGPSDTAIDVVTYNVLAPPWASSTWYPEIDEPALLDTVARRERLTAYLRSVASTAEIVCLQEVAASELPHLAEALGPGFAGAMSSNDPDFWSEWVVPPVEWEPNGTAIFARLSAFSDIEVEDRALGTGNHAAVLAATHTATGTDVRAWSMHLDSDRTNNRATEIDVAFDAMTPAEGAVDVVCGDLNEDAVTGTVGGIVRRAGFVDVLAALGNREGTHPWTDGYYRSQRWAILDHVLVRGAVPVGGHVVDAGAAGIADQSTRIEEFLRRMGSDHYPVVATVQIPDSVLGN